MDANSPDDGSPLLEPDGVDGRVLRDTVQRARDGARDVRAVAVAVLRDGVVVDEVEGIDELDALEVLDPVEALRFE